MGPINLGFFTKLYLIQQLTWRIRLSLVIVRGHFVILDVYVVRIAAGERQSQRLQVGQGKPGWRQQ